MLPFDSHVMLIVVSSFTASEVPLCGDVQPLQQQTRAAETKVQES